MFSLQRAAVRLRFVLGIVLGLVFVLNLCGPAAADLTTGVLSGTVTSATGTPVSGAAITLVAPSGRRTSTTDTRGFFSITGVNPDTYTVTIAKPGYDTLTIPGVTVNPQQTTTLTPTLQTRLAVIGRTAARSANAAFQPTQTTDTYTLNSQQMTNILGNQFNVSESQLIAALPGASFDSNGYPVLRGGRENEEGFQFDGIDYTDAFTSQFVNSLALNGQSSFQLTPGAGDATTGNAGTGAINILVKRGTRPAFGTFDLEAGGPAFNHQLSTEYGFATPNGRFSNFTSFIGSRSASVFGYRNSDLVSIGEAIQFSNGQAYNTANDLVNNMSYKFGPNNNQQLQFLYQNQQVNFFGASAPGTQFRFRSGDPVALDFFGGITGLSRPTVGSIFGFDRYQTAQNQLLSSVNAPPEAIYQPNETFKLQYSINLGASTFATAKYYRVGAVATFDFPYNFSGAGGAAAGDIQGALQGGNRTGYTVDVTTQLGAKNLLTAGAKYEYVHPVFSEISSSLGLLGPIIQGFSAGNGVYDFVPAANADCVNLASFFGANPCGYLSPFFANGIPRVPPFQETTVINRQDASVYLTDSFTPTTKLKIDAGLRLDTTNIQMPSVTSGAFLPASGGGYSSGFYLPVHSGVDANGNPDPTKDVYDTGGAATQHPAILEPRLAVAYNFRPSDSLRVSYGRSVQFAPITDLDHVVDRSVYRQFAGIPANAQVCGPTGDRVCRDYADQLYWINQNQISGVPIQPAKPATFNNWEASLAHDFGHGVSAKLTPFYRRGYDGLALVATPRLNANGTPITNPDGSVLLNPAVTTNLGVTRTSGVEFYLTKEARYGLSGTLSLTYLNEFSNVIPGSTSEDFFPSIPLPSLALGNLYRVGFLSPFNGNLALAYTTRSGWRINPTVNFNNGYPYGSGNLTANFVNGVALNIPQTNVTVANTIGSNAATNYVDPQNPGTVINPNIAATRGTPEAASAGGNLTVPRAHVNLTIEYTEPTMKTTFGLQIFNLFNNVYGQPALNGSYQPLATGIAGAQTGSSALTQIYGPQLGFANFGPALFGGSPYVIVPNNNPLTFQLYIQKHL